MSNKIIIGLMLIMILPIANALTEGQVIDQEELNNMTVEDEDYQCGYHAGTMAWENYYNTPIMLTVQGSCLRIQRYYENHYVVIKDTNKVNYPLKNIIQCVNQHGGPYCLSILSQYFLTQLEEHREQAVREAWYMQERNSPFTINEALFNITWK